MGKESYKNEQDKRRRATNIICEAFLASVCLMRWLPFIASLHALCAFFVNECLAVCSHVATHTETCCNTMQHTATHCNTLPHTATQHKKIYHVGKKSYKNEQDKRRRATKNANTHKHTHTCCPPLPAQFLRDAPYVCIHIIHLFTYIYIYTHT